MNYKVEDLIETYNFDIKFDFTPFNMKSHHFFLTNNSLSVFTDSWLESVVKTPYRCQFVMRTADEN